MDRGSRVDNFKENINQTAVVELSFEKLKFGSL